MQTAVFPRPTPPLAKINKSDLVLLENIGRYGLEDGLRRTAKSNRKSLTLNFSRWQVLISQKMFPAEFDLSVGLNRWEFADTCRRLHDAGMWDQAIANLMKCSYGRILEWIEVSKTFSPVYRSKKLAPSAYLYLLKMPDPLKAALFARREMLDAYGVLHLYWRYLEYTRKERLKPTGQPFRYVDQEEILERYRKRPDARITAVRVRLSIYTVIAVLKKHGIKPSLGCYDLQIPIGRHGRWWRPPLEWGTQWLRRQIREQGLTPLLVRHWPNKILLRILPYKPHQRVVKFPSLPTGTTDISCLPVLENVKLDSFKNKVAKKVVKNDFIKTKAINTGNVKVEALTIAKQDNELTRLYNSGLSDQEIANALKLSRATVIRRRQKLGLPALRKVGGRGPGIDKGAETQRHSSDNKPVNKLDKKPDNNKAPSSAKKPTAEERTVIKSGIASDLLIIQPLVELQKQIDLLQQENAKLRRGLIVSQKLCVDYLHELGRKTGLRYRVEKADLEPARLQKGVR